MLLKTRLNMNPNNLCYCLLFLLFISCNSDTDENPFAGKTNLSLVTGLDLRSTIGQPALRLGNPNTHNPGLFTAYPNPPIGTLFISSGSEISNVWIVSGQANKSFRDTDFEEILHSGLYDTADIISSAELSLENPHASQVSLNLEALENGYYRVFAEINGVLYWDNIYASDGSLAIEDLIKFWE